MNEATGAKRMTILVLGGTGKVGTDLLRSLLEQEQTVRVLVHKPERAALVPAEAEVYVANVVEDPDAARFAFQGRRCRIHAERRGAS